MFTIVMRLLFAISILFSLCFQCSMQLGIVGWYELNKRSITEQYCVNKNKPQMHCNGKCHLKKQLDNTNSRQDPQTSSSQTEWAVFVLPSSTELPTHIFSRNTTCVPYPPANYHLLLTDLLFRPPQTS